ncbi:MAG: TetR/AcrR family transcriptional regulator [Pseudomonadota bacterium]|nr:TetR/AcrR family transcriptional regulator [Pseudomonadota bacterium]
MPATPRPSPPRRTPVQARSRARVDAILDAADAVFLEMGFAAATTNHVAARAGTSIGSLYRFFPDKEAILVALAERYGERMRAIAVTVSPPDPRGQTLAGLVGNGIDRFNAYLVASPGIRTLIEQAGHPALRAGRQAHESAMATLIRASQARVAGGMPAAELDAVVEVTQVVLGALQVLSVSRDATFRALVVEEAKRMVTTYLARRLGVAEDAPLGGQ